MLCFTWPGETMNIKAETVIQWMDLNLPPLSWRIIVMKQMKLLLKHKISPASIGSNTYFNTEIMTVLRQVVKDDYGKDLPNF
jgi:hypothetical protein